MWSSRGLIVVVSAPSGAGKTTLCRLLLERNPSMTYSVSCTTRSPRAGESHGREYFFLSREEFVRTRDTDGLAEWAQVHDNLYGTPRSFLDGRTEAGFDVLLDIDVQGAAQLTAVYPDAVSIFLLPPSWDVLEGRLRGRGTESPEAVELRLAAAKREMARVWDYSYVVVNDVLGDAAARVEAILAAQRCRRERIDRDVFERIYGIGRQP